MEKAVPRPYRVLSVGRTLLVASPEAVEPARRALREHGTLLAFAASHPGSHVLDSRRGRAYGVPMADGRWVVRHYRRGGALTRWLGDRYLRAGLPRPVRELRVSHAARERGVDTPRVVALAVYPAGAFYRADLATEYVPRSSNLAQTLFGAEARGPEDRVRALAAVGRLIRTAHERGIIHVDLTLQNVLLEWVAPFPRPYLLDLDACHIAPRALPAWRREAMLRRFARSLRGWEERAARSLTDVENRAFQAGYLGGEG
jgi:serine/threonine protein kinase